MWFFYSANRLLIHMQRDGFFADGVAGRVKHLGIGVILFWVGLILAEDVFPWVISWNVPEEYRFPLE